MGLIRKQVKSIKRSTYSEKEGKLRAKEIVVEEKERRINEMLVELD